MLYKHTVNGSSREQIKLQFLPKLQFGQACVRTGGGGLPAQRAILGLSVLKEEEGRGRALN